MTLKELRKSKDLTQKDCANYLNIPYRTYCRYEVNESNIDHIKYQYIMQRLTQYGQIDEEHGILTIEQITDVCRDVFAKYDVGYCYLFGSYAKGKATEYSDVDLLVAVPIDGIKFFEMIEFLREQLKKKVDVLDVAQLDNNPALLQEILKDGIKIYG